MKEIPDLISLIRAKKAHSFLYRVASLHPLYFFPVILVISALFCIWISLRTKPTDEKTLMNFYRTVRPWGFWKPIHEKVAAKYPDFRKNMNFKRDIMNIIIGIIAQTSLVALPVFIVIKNWNALLITIAITLTACIILKKTWYDHLEE